MVDEGAVAEDGSAQCPCPARCSSNISLGARRDTEDARTLSSTGAVVRYNRCL